MDLDTLDLPALAAAADVSARTVRYYIQQGLLPAPESRGPGAHYTGEHLARLRLIKRMQREHLPLAEIRRRLEALAPADIQRLAAEPEARGPRSSARDYIRDVLSEGPAMMQMRAMRMSPPMSAMDAAAAGSAAPAPVPMAVSSALPTPDPRSPTPATRAQYDRITLAPDVELHIRRPLSREQNRQVERLLQAARAIFEEDTP
jgi:DNA-binding transcriptional MerR regulator